MENQEKGLNLLAVFRILIGWLFLWGFLDKMFGLGFETPAGSGMIDGGSPSSFVVYVTSGIFKDLYTALAGNWLIDIVFMLGLLVLGITLITGIASKLTTLATSAFLLAMWTLCVPPTDNPLIDYHLILIAGIVAAYYLGGFRQFSLYDRWQETWLVKRFPIFG